LDVFVPIREFDMFEFLELPIVLELLIDEFLIYELLIELLP